MVYEDKNYLLFTKQSSASMAYGNFNIEMDGENLDILLLPFQEEEDQSLEKEIEKQLKQ